jgi:nucleoside-diphosphate-sugar epimerase
VGTFNVVSGNSMTFLDVAKLMITASGVKSQIELQSSNVIVSEIKYDNGKLIGVLGYSISDSLSRGIQKFFQR